MEPFFFHPRDLDLQADHLFWRRPPDDAFLASMDRFGQLTPALVMHGADAPPVLVAGARRTAALRELRGRPLAATVFDPNDPDSPESGDAALPLPLRLGLRYLASNLGQTVTDAMLVAAGRYFTSHGSADDFFHLAGPLLLAPGDRRGRQLGAWLGLPRSLDPLLGAGQVPLACAASLAGCDPETLTALTPLLEAVRWSRANLENALTWITEAARLAGDTPGAVLARSGALELCARDLSPNDRTAGILAALRRLRYPATVSLEARFATLSRELTRGSRLKLRPSQGFEADTVTVELTVRRPEDAATAARELAGLAGQPALAKLLRLAHDDTDDADGDPA